MFNRISTFLNGKTKSKNRTFQTTSNKKIQTNRTTIYEKSSCSKLTTFDKKKLECKVIFLDSSEQIFKMEKDSTGEDLMNQVVRTLDLVERDYFSLQFEFGDQQVKFFPLDPDELVEELTRYHFYLQARKDIKERKLSPPYHICVELAALSIQSELGDYEDLQNNSDYVKNFKFIPKQTEEFETQVSNKHRGLLYVFERFR